MTTEDLIQEITDTVDKANGISKSVLAYAISRKKIFNINIDVKGPCVVIPEQGWLQK